MLSTKQLFGFSGLSCLRGGRLLFQNVSFGLDAGEILHLSGRNGVGKSSLLRVLAGALPPAAGEILWAGRPFLADGAEEHAKRFSFLSADDRSLKVLETAAENLAFWAEITGCEEGAASAALTSMGIAALRDTPVRSFSAGQKRRLSLSRLLLKQTRLWLLDEPFNGLDAPASALFMAALARHCAAGGMAVVASHLPLELPAGGLHAGHVGVALRRLELAGDGA